MFSQFFGGYLLNHNIVSREQLSKALDEKKNTRLRLGVLAINEGLMTSEQVELVNVTQQTVDMRFGDLCVHMGFLKDEDVEMLLHKQPTDYLLLGQALVNMGALTNAAFEKAINDYKETLRLDDEDLSGERSEALSQMVSEFYHFSTARNARLYTNYVTLLFKSLIRFIGDDFTPLDASICRTAEGSCVVRQMINGAYTGTTIVSAELDEYRAFARRFAKDAYMESDEFDDASVQEFLNVINGLYAVNESNESGTEIGLEPLSTFRGETVQVGTEAFSIPVQFTFGEVEFIVAF